MDVLTTAKTQRGHTRATAVKAFFSTMMDIHALVCMHILLILVPKCYMLKSWLKFYALLSICGFNLIAEINECQNGNSSNCEQVCMNTIGSYECACYEGYGLNQDGLTCTGMVGYYLSITRFD